MFEVMLTEGAPKKPHVCGFARVEVCCYLNSFKMEVSVAALPAIEFLSCSREACDRKIDQLQYSIIYIDEESLRRVQGWFDGGGLIGVNWLHYHHICHVEYFIDI